MNYNFQQILQSWQAKDPNFIDMLVELAKQPNPPAKKPVPDDELTFEKFLDKILSWEFQQKHPDVQFAERLAMIAKLEADEGIYPLPERFKIHLILTTLWQDNSPYARAVLADAIDRLPLTYGVWKGFKYIFKQAESCHDYAMFARVAVRVDMERRCHYYQHQPIDILNGVLNPVSHATKTYISLRAWRFLRNIGEQSAFLYPNVASEVLACYIDAFTESQSTEFHYGNSWLLNHILFHHSESYGVKSFSIGRKKRFFDAKGRAFAESWQRDSQPLFYLLQQAKSEKIRQFATDSLKHDFASELRNIAAENIQQLSNNTIKSNAKDELIVWLLNQSPNFSQADFVKLGLDDVVLKLMFSGFAPAYEYAFAYARTYVPNLPLTTLLLLAESQEVKVRQFAIEQICAKDAKKDVGLDNWGKLLDSQYHHQVASKQLLKFFTKKDFTHAWFAERLFSNNSYGVEFAVKNLTHFYTFDALGIDYLVNLCQKIIDDCQQKIAIKRLVIQFLLTGLKELGVTKLDKYPQYAKFWQKLLLHPVATDTVQLWLNDKILPANLLAMDFWHALVSPKDWQQNDWIAKLKASDLPWERHLQFDANLASFAVEILADVRVFSPPSLGFDWLLTLVNSENSLLRNFAIDRINKGFLPADFAPQSQSSEPQAADVVIEVDLQQQTFLFTGKLASMTRDGAENMVKQANGKINSGVNAKLDFLVIGDDGSPLYGSGRKGSKQLKAESLIENGVNLKIISETAFLQMLSGQSRNTDNDQVLAGAEALWQMATQNPNDPMSELATTYLAHHHEQLCMALTDRPVDPDAIIPHEFFSAKRVIPLFHQGNLRLREFALQLATFELANWQILADDWQKMAESPHQDVQDLLQKALLEKPCNENRRYHQNADKLTAEILYGFLDSQKHFARQLGIKLLMRYPQFQDPQNLFYLTESTDRQVRYAAVKMLWQQHHQRHFADWQPKNNNALTKRIKQLPADMDFLLLLLKRGLFEVPPARLPDSYQSQNEQKTKKYAFGRVVVAEQQYKPKSISASRNKLALVETFRDVALEDKNFAQYVLPVLQKFTLSAGKMERHACLVAVTRLQQRYPDLIDI